MDQTKVFYFVVGALIVVLLVMVCHLYQNDQGQNRAQISIDLDALLTDRTT